ncbi:MAG: LacI family transcriptional regulator, partial [Lachnospiraceae bacterium]|nr:LacI family transcriptional regulator [Lachnospiraceae bacterium]
DNSPISREAVIPISTVGQQIDKIAFEAVNLLVEQMNERKKRRPVPLEAPIHKVVPPVLFRRATTEKEIAL